MRRTLLLLALAACVACAAATEYTPEARADQIANLPGLEKQAGFNQFSGYLTVDKANNRNIFYWYVESTNKPDTDPLVWWSNGGPGCSGLLGLLTEHGPFRPSPKGGLIPFEYSWNRLANILYVEAPAGVGFSFSDNAKDYYTNDTITANDNYLALQAFFEKFPHLLKNDLYISGESYGGHYIPQLAEVIVKKNPTAQTKFNFKGFFLGNPIANMQENENEGFGGTICGQSLASKPTCDAFNLHCLRPEGPDGACGAAKSQVTREAGNLDMYGLNFPVCNGNSAQKAHILRQMNKARLQRMDPARRARMQSQLEMMPEQYDACLMDEEEAYLNLPEVRKALHVSDKVRRWLPCDQDSVHYDMSNLYIHMEPTYVDLIRVGGLRMVIFSGDDDAVCATTGTQHWMHQTWGKEVVSKWKSWSYKAKDYGTQVGGYVTKFKGISLVTVHGAGHMVPTYQPEKGFVVFEKFLKGEFDYQNGDIAME